MNKFTVIINTYPHEHREKDLLRNIHALTRQSYQDFSILLVENHNDQRKVLPIIKKSKLKKNKYRIIVNPAKKLSLLFNFAWKNSATEYLAFIADDAEPNKDWLKEIDNEFKAGKHTAVVTGPIISTIHPAGEMHRLYLLSQKNMLLKLLAWPYLHFAMEDKVLKPGYLFSSGAYSIGAGLKEAINFKREKIDLATTTSMGVKKEFLNEVKGFDEHFNFNHADGDLFIRIKKNGGSIIFTPKVIAYHHVRQGPSRNAYFIGLDTGYFYKKHIRPKSVSGFLGMMLNILVLNFYWIYSSFRNKDVRQLKGILGFIEGLIR